MNNFKHNFPLAYMVLEFRKRDNKARLGLSFFRALVKRSEAIGECLESSADCYTSLAYEAKKEIYRKRYDLERELESVIHAPIEMGLTCTIRQSWDICYNGYGTSDQTSKKLKIITCKEKRRKSLVSFINRLAELSRS